MLTFEAVRCPMRSSFHQPTQALICSEKIRNSFLQYLHCWKLATKKTKQGVCSPRPRRYRLLIYRIKNKRKEFYKFRLKILEMWKEKECFEMDDVYKNNTSPHRLQKSEANQTRQNYCTIDGQCWKTPRGVQDGYVSVFSRM